jgi:hypothetical protein
MEGIEDGSCVVVLDYTANEHDAYSAARVKNFNTIRKRYPNAQVTLLSSKERIPRSTIELQRNATAFILKRERAIKALMRKQNEH